MRLEPAPGMATRLALSVPGSAGTAGCEPSMDTVSWELVREMTSGDFLFLCRPFWMDAASDGRLANWWNTLRLRMMAYTRLQFPGGRGAGVHVCVCNVQQKVFRLRFPARLFSYHRTGTGLCC